MSQQNSMINLADWLIYIEFDQRYCAVVARYGIGVAGNTNYSTLFPQPKKNHVQYLIRHSIQYWYGCLGLKPSCRTYAYLSPSLHCTVHYVVWTAQEETLCRIYMHTSRWQVRCTEYWIGTTVLIVPLSHVCVLSESTVYNDMY